jgi:hypothetical protein
MIEIRLPIRLQSPNVKEHWTKTHKRNKRISQVIGFSLRTNSEVSRFASNIDIGIFLAGFRKNEAMGFKIKITLVKLGRMFDYDNMVYAFKPVRDSICSFFFPDLAPGQADCQKCFDILYLQEKGASGIKIILEFFDQKGEPIT